MFEILPSVPEALDSKKLVGYVETVVKAPQKYCEVCTRELAVDARHLIFIEGTMILSIG